MGLFRALSNIIYKEYDRRIRRASLIKEYGAAHHHAGEEHEAEEHEAEDEAEIANVPRGTPIAAHPPADPHAAHE
jgi:hypothetical protein